MNRVFSGGEKCPSGTVGREVRKLKCENKTKKNAISLSVLYLYMHVCMLSHFSRFQLFVILWIEAHQAPLSMGFSRQEYWSRWPCIPPGDFPHPGLEPTSPASPSLQADSLPLSHQGSPIYIYICM